MKTTHIIKALRIPLVLAASFLAGVTIVATAAETPTSKGGAARVIQLHAPNNATQSVTVWIPKTAPRRTSAASAKGGAAKLVELHAPNNATSSVTVWTHK